MTDAVHTRACTGIKNGHNSVTVQNRAHVYINFFDHKDLGNHLLQLCPKVVKHLYDSVICTWNILYDRYTQLKTNVLFTLRTTFMIVSEYNVTDLNYVETIYLNLALRSALFFCRLFATSVNILSSFSLYWHYMFRRNWPSSVVQVVVMKESSAEL
jgi:hypothetical protein